MRRAGPIRREAYAAGTLSQAPRSAVPFERGRGEFDRDLALRVGAEARALDGDAQRSPHLDLAGKRRLWVGGTLVEELEGLAEHVGQRAKGLVPQTPENVGSDEHLNGRHDLDALARLLDDVARVHASGIGVGGAQDVP
jgi:hypothetical protein